MKNLRMASCLLVLLVVNACASVQTTGRRSFDGDQNLAKPTRIIVYDFAATADDVAASSAITGGYKRRSTPQTANEIRLGRDLGHRVALALVKDILAMGLPEAPGMAVPLVVMGGILGRPVQAAAISGGANILQELGPERIQATADRTASEIAKLLRHNFRRRGWI